MKALVTILVQYDSLTTLTDLFTHTLTDSGHIARAKALVTLTQVGRHTLPMVAILAVWFTIRTVHILVSR